MRSSNLNLGCGNRFHPDWENLDFSPVAPAVRACDLRKGIPFPDASFSVVYHSHVLEHFSKNAGVGFLRECHRVLKPGGIVRVAVPDLQRMAALYLEAFDKASQGIPGWADNYDWMLLEMYDQTVRESSGGEMAAFVQKAPSSLKPFLRERLGGELDGILRMPLSAKASSAPRSFKDRMRRSLLGLLLGTEGVSAYDCGKFRRSGEIHQWMYDSHSLARLLESSSFASPRKVGPTESAIPDWVSFNLDTEPNGAVYKPDSLYMEATNT